MRRIFVLILALVPITGILLAQKNLLNHATSGTWPTIGDKAISNNGKYVKYTIDIPNSGTKFFILAVDHSWEMQLSGITQSFFSPDSRKLIFTKGKDSLCTMDLGTEHIRYITSVSSIVSPEVGNSNFIAYRRSPDKSLTLFNLDTQQQVLFQDVDDYFFNRTGTVLVLNMGKDTVLGKKVVWLDLTSGKSTVVCHSCLAGKYVFNEAGNAIAFSPKESARNSSITCIYYYQVGMKTACSIDSATSGMRGLSIAKGGSSIFFSESGRWLYISTMKSGDRQINSEPVRAESPNLYIELPDNISRDNNRAKAELLTSFDLKNPMRGLVLLGKRADIVFGKNDTWVLRKENISGDPEYVKTDINARPDIYLVSMATGERQLIKKRLLGGIDFSPSGKYLTWFDQVSAKWFTYNIEKRETKNISAAIKEPITVENDEPDFPINYDLGGWLKDDKGLLIYGRNDIWLADPDGIKSPIDLTHGYGKHSNIRFRRIDLGPENRSFIDPEDTLILSAFNLNNKNDGFFRLSLNDRKLEKLIMSPKVYTEPQVPDFCGGSNPQSLIKAKQTNVYVLSRMSATEYPNLYATSDFRHFEPLTDLEPQRNYNWYTSELLHWKLPNGKQAEGILYKPENFDPHKKYPVIFYYYQQISRDLNEYINPQLSEFRVNIPWFVSNGYLVCVPDIYYKDGYPGRSALNSVESAAEYLAQKSWVDVRNLGLQGHSFGGSETNYIVSHSKLFKAAAPAAGDTNAVEGYAEIFGPFWWEARQGRIGATLWQRPDLYIENSAVFKADQVTADVLIMHTQGDHDLQAKQWYTDLHRLGKKAWLLMYTGGENHYLQDPKNMLDCSIRLGQFFDYELKGMPPPKWMTTVTDPGKGDLGYDLDTSKSKP